MMGTSRAMKGGISSVVQVYVDAGLFDRFPIHYIATHCDGKARSKLRIMAAAYLELIGMLIGRNVALLHVHVSTRASFWRKYGLFQLAHLFRVPTILHLHSGAFNKFYEEECGPVRQWLVRRLFNKVERVVVLSQRWKLWVNSISTNPRVVALYNPVIMEQLQAPAETRDAASILTLGRLNQGKGSYDLLAAAAGFAGPVQLMLGGDGEIEKVRQRASELGLSDQVNLLGWVGPEDKPNYLARATVYALPSYAEGLPMSVLEAMAAGVPVVTTPVGGIPEAVTDGIEGFLVEPGDIDTLRARLTQLLEDSELAVRMGEAGREKVKSAFSSAVILPKLESMYVELGCSPKV
jgi:glycosyltransferase involved in cell wall biosynthesis